ncbi:hypothetical protein LTR85_003533 [Meristemomyces frigidus]|nr:hypothetical protein LTR85_003533 [Meristemomyces frigidus]
MDNSPFARLSAELRNEIYRAVFDDDESVDLKQDLEPALTRTCRQLRTESALLFYKNARFSANYDDQGTVAKWLGSLNTQKAGAISYLQLKTTDASIYRLYQTRCHPSTPDERPQSAYAKIYTNGVVEKLVSTIKQSSISPVAVEVNLRFLTRLEWFACYGHDFATVWGSDWSAEREESVAKRDRWYTEWQDDMQQLAERLCLHVVYGRDFDDEDIKDEMLEELDAAREKLRAG